MMDPNAILQIPTLAHLLSGNLDIRFGGRDEKRNPSRSPQAQQPGVHAHKRRILNISYNEPILRTRHAILEEAGMDVVSALGFSEALQLCAASRFDLVVIGPSLPEKDKTLLIAAVRDLCSSPILSLRRAGLEPHPDADYSADSNDGPEALLELIEQIFRGKVN